MTDLEIKMVLGLVETIGPWGVMIGIVWFWYVKYGRGERVNTHCLEQIARCEKEFVAIAGRLNKGEDRFEEIKNKLHDIDLTVKGISTRMDLNGNAK